MTDRLVRTAADLDSPGPSPPCHTQSPGSPFTV